MTEKKWDAAIEAIDGEIYVIADGLRVAKRGHPGTAHAGKWIPLEPGYVVISDADLSVLTIEKNGVVMQ
jgi:hypothetical protein